MAIPATLEASAFGRRRVNWQALLLTLLLGLVCFLVLTPVLWTLFNSFQVSQPWEPAVYGLDGWRRAFSSHGIVSAITNTFSLAIVRQAIAVFAGILLAWILARTDIPWKGWMEVMFWYSFFIPALPVTLGWILALDPKIGIINGWLAKLPFVDGPVFNIYSYWGIIWTHITASTLGIKVMFLTPAFRNMDAALEEASRVAGAGSMKTLSRIVVPIMLPVILSTTTLGLIRSLETFEIELILGVPVGIEVYATKIHELITTDPTGGFGPATALSSFFLFVLLVLVLVQHVCTSRTSYATVSGRFSSRPVSLGRWKWPVFFLVLLTVLAVTAIPVVFLLMGTFMSVFGFFDIPEPWTLQHWSLVLGDATFFQSLKNTLIVALGSAVIGVLFYSLIAYVIVKSKFAGKKVLDFVSWLPWALPGILLGVGLLWTFLQTPGLNALYGTVYLMMVAIIIKSMPLGVQMTKSVMLQLGDELEEASRICGASWLETYRRVLLPLLLPMLTVVGLLVFNSAARDISTVVLLGTGDSRTLSLLMLEWAIGGGALEKATVVGAIIVVIVVITSLIARKLGGPTRFGA
jgi:iron(III) transport system permease protein